MVDIENMNRYQLRDEVERLRAVEFIHAGCRGLREKDNAYLLARAETAEAESARLASEQRELAAQVAGLRSVVAKVEVLADEWEREADRYDTYSTGSSISAELEQIAKNLRSDATALRATIASVAPGPTPNTGEWDMRSGSMCFDREEWGVIIDALIQHRGHAEQRKAVNSESTSDVRADMCADLIGRIRLAALASVGVSGSADDRREANASQAPDTPYDGSCLL